MSNIVISVENLWKQYRIGLKKSTNFRESIGQWFTKDEAELFWALQDINFEVKAGEAVGIIGKNGAGKSTLLKVLSKITYPTKGRIEIDGRVSSLLEVGTGFHPELSGRQNVYLNGTILGMTRKEIDSKFDEIVAFSGVEQFIDTPVKRYSSGMKVRLAFSVAAHLEPEILIIDEVLAVGDAEFQKKCLGKMENVTGDGRTIIFVSHNMAAIKSLCTDAILLENGSLTYQGNVNDCIDKYLVRSNAKNVFNTDGQIGNERVKIANIEFVDKDEKSTPTIFSGMSLTIKISYESSEIPKNLIFRIQFVSSTGQVLFVCNNYHSSSPFNLNKNSGFVRCTIKDLPLNAGQYHINIQCIENSDVVNEIEEAISFHVEKGDFFGTSKLPNQNQGILMKHEWTTS